MTTRLLKHWKFILVFLFIAFFYLYKLGQIPNGIFCDEAEIGVEAYKILHGQHSSLVSPFFYEHLGYLVGNLEVFAAIPFVAIFGLNDFSIRFVSVFFALLSLVLIYIILLELKFKNSFLSILYIGLTPVWFHIARINFGHFPALFFIFLGIYFWLAAKRKNRIILAVFSGISFGISLYGYNGFMIATPLFLFLLLFSEFISNRKMLFKYRIIFLTLFVFSVFIIPIVVNAVTNPAFKKRLIEKNQGEKNFMTKDKLKNIINNYPKYYSIDYLFTKGEISMPGGNNTRHFVKSSGIFYKFFGLLFVCGLIMFFKKLRENLKFLLPILPFILLFFFYPLPDIITTLSISPPYTFAIFSTIFFFPFLVAFSNHFISKKPIIVIIFFLLFLIEFSNFFFVKYLKYPQYSSDYWGWQAGSKEIVNYFISERKNYDALYIGGDFNGGPQVFLEFYDPEKTCGNCFPGGIEMYNPRKRQLFAIRMVSYNLYIDKRFFRIKKTVFLPNGQAEYYIGEYFKN